MNRSLKVGMVLCVLVGLGAVGWFGSSFRNQPGSAIRLSGSVSAKEPARVSGDSLGYGTAFAAELKKIGQISPEEFSQRFGGKATHLAGIGWDPTQATFFDRFNTDPTQPGAKVRARGAEKMLRFLAKHQGKPLPDNEPVMVPIHGTFDFRLNDAERSKFKQNGFVVSERLGSSSCTDMYYRIFKRDLPVLVTSDALLHAWHRSYDALLEEVETAMLIPALGSILDAMAAEIPKENIQYGNGIFKESIADVDYFLAVARSLLRGFAVKSMLGNDARVAHTIDLCHREQIMEQFELFGSKRDVDFSQFKPRGHYEKSEELKRYFRAMMWCGRIDLRVAGNPNESSAQLASAVVLHDLLQKSGKFEQWSMFDHMIQTFVGKADSMTFAQLSDVLAASGIRTPADVKDQKALAGLGERIGASDFGAQEIRGDLFWTDEYRPGKLVLPRSFAFLGQRFVVDSWVTANVVYDDVTWNGEKVMRRIPSCLDVSFTVFGNDQTVPLLVERINNKAGRKFRDGLNYQHNLAALRTVIDGKRETVWQDNLYNGWLGCLRELSKPTTARQYPEAMRTQAWAMKTLNTQHASWSQLRHDTILYAKQSYTGRTLCYYPAGFVEPVPHFWANLKQMAACAGDLITATPYPDPQIRDKHAKFLRNFAKTVNTLQGIAEKELAQKELSKEETKFLEDVVEIVQRVGSGGGVTYSGWYPALFYFGGEDSLKWDALVADVHTNPPDQYDPVGCVLQQGVGSVDLLLLAVDNGKDRMVFAGPVLSHYEFEMAGVARKSDSEWKADLQAGKTPPRPEWTRAYLVPGHNAAVKSYPAGK